MSENKPFKMAVEGRLFSLNDRVNIDSASSVTPGEFVGLVSLSSNSFEMTDAEIFELLDSAHARTSFVLRFLDLHNEKTGSLRKLGVSSAQSLVFDDMTVVCYITEDYLETVTEEFANGERVRDSLDRYDTEVEVYESDAVFPGV